MTLITQTLIGDASRLIDGIPIGKDYLQYMERKFGLTLPELQAISWTPPTTLGRVLNLASLTDCIVLNEKLVTLKGYLPPDLREASLRRRLLTEGVVQEIEVDDSLSQKIADNLKVFLSNVETDRTVAREERAKEVALEVCFQMLSPSKFPPDWQTSEELRSNIKNNYFYRAGELWIETEHTGYLYPSPSHLTSLVESIVTNIGGWPSAHESYGVSHVRTLVYWLLANEQGIPIQADCARIQIYDSLFSEVRESLTPKFRPKIGTLTNCRWRDFRAKFPAST